ncbi:unnamed protein product, partial [Coregonus sp. 'balchen']
MFLSLTKSRLRPVVPPKPSNLKALGPNIPNNFQTKNQNQNQPPSGDRSQWRKQHQLLEGKVKRIVRQFSSQENEVMGQAGLGTGTGAGAETVTGAKQGDSGVVWWTRTEAGQQADSDRGQTGAGQADYEAIIMSPSVELSLIPPPVPLRKPRSGPQTQPTAQSHAVPLGQETDHHQSTLLTPGHGQENRSAPDGSDVDEAPVCVTMESSQTPGSAAPPCGHHGNRTQCQCICHLRRTGMKLVWVPLEEEEEEDYVEVIGDEEKEKRGNEDQKRERTEENEEMLGSFGAEERGGKSQTGCQTETAAVFSELREVRVHEVSENNSQRSISSKHNTSSITQQHRSNTKQTKPPQNNTETDEDEVTYEAIPMIDRKEPPPRPMKPPLTHKMKHPSTQKDHLQRTLSTSSLSGLLTSISKSDIQKSTPPPQTPPSISHGNPHQPILRPLPPLPVLHDLRLLPCPIMPHPPQLRPQMPVKPLPPNPEPSGPSCPRRHSSTDADVGDDWVTVDEEEGEEPQEQADKPLYQIYQAKTIKEAIRLQSISRSASRATVDHHVRLGGGHTVAGTAGGQRQWDPGDTQSRGAAETGGERRMGGEEGQREGEREGQGEEGKGKKKGGYSMFEVLTSEASYLHSLNVLTDHFLMCRDLDDTLVIHDKKTLFSNILHVYEVSQRIDENILITDVCDIIHQYALYDFSVYIDYIRNQGYQERAYSSLMITRIKILVQIIKESNTQVGQMKQMEELIQVSNTLEFNKLK